MKVHFQKLTYRLHGEKGKDMNTIIGMENAGFTIIDAKNTNGGFGYAIGKKQKRKRMQTTIGGLRILTTA